MTDDQFNQMMAVLTSIDSRLEAAVWLLTCVAVGVGLLWGLLQFRVWLISKEHTRFW